MVRMLFIVILAGLLPCVMHAEVLQTARILENQPNYSIDIQYPKGFAEPEIETLVRHFLDAQKKEFLAQINEEKGSAKKKSLGKNTLTIQFKIPYQQGEALSILFQMTHFHQGAAHPVNTTVSYNFIQGKPVKLADLFLRDSPYLQRLADLSREQLLPEVPDQHWMEEGTKPELNHYRIWYFSQQGLVIVFDTYQVAPYYLGPQRTHIPKTALVHLIKPEIAHAVWGK